MTDTSLIPRTSEYRDHGLAERLRLAAIAIEGRPDVLTETHLPALVDLAQLLEHINHAMPDVLAWCVIKYYSEHVPGGAWKPRVWTAHTTKEQAEEYAPVIQKFYADRSPHLTPDTFKVERKSTNIFKFINPEMSATDYVARIG